MPSDPSVSPAHQHLFPLPATRPSCGWSGTIERFLVLWENAWLNDLSTFHGTVLRLATTESQLAAWRGCFRILQRQLPRLVHDHPGSAAWTIAFEYVLPTEDGRRPDVIILADSAIFV